MANRWQYEIFEPMAVIYHPNRKIGEAPAITLSAGWGDLAPDITKYLNSTTDVDIGPDEYNEE